jgi:hypothetical protein
MSTVTINKQKYEVPELNFRHSKQLELCGVPLYRMNDISLMFTIVSAFVSVVVGCDPEYADYLVEQHILGGGNIEDIYKAYIQAIADSHFFKKLLENQEQKKTVKKTTKAMTPNE